MMNALKRRLVAALIFGVPLLAGAQSLPLAPRPPELTQPPPAQPPAVPGAAEAELVPPRREDATWRATLERIAQSVVAIKIDSTRAFDTEWNTSAQATG